MKTKSICNSFSTEQSICLCCILLNSCCFWVCIPEQGNLVWGACTHMYTATFQHCSGTGAGLGRHLSCALNWEALPPYTALLRTHLESCVLFWTPRNTLRCWGVSSFGLIDKVEIRLQKTTPYTFNIGLSNFCLLYKVFWIVNTTYNTTPNSFCS